MKSIAILLIALSLSACGKTQAEKDAELEQAVQDLMQMKQEMQQLNEDLEKFNELLDAYERGQLKTADADIDQQYQKLMEKLDAQKSKPILVTPDGRVIINPTEFRKIT